MTHQHAAAIISTQRQTRLATVAAWLLLALMVAVMAWTGLRACSLRGPLASLFAPYCEAPTGDAIPVPDNQLAELTAQVRELEGKLNLSPACAISNCPERHPAQIAFILDTSGSMKYCLTTPRQLEDEVLALDRAGLNRTPEYEALRLRAECETPLRRIDLAKQALGSLNLAPEAILSLTTFPERCTVKLDGPFAADARTDFEASVQRASPHGETPLAKAFDTLAATLEAGKTADAPVSIVVLSDGGDNCNGDVCASARTLKRARPYAQVHMIAIGGDPSVHECVVEATGGNLVHVRDRDDVIAALQQFTGEVSTPGCAAQP
ncbi:MAG: hypothetical protein H6948_17930 [Zoogloeaceae bacterium]|nr:hypothetical protein [Zoogloeaceae bacterium]